MSNCDVDPMMRQTSRAATDSFQVFVPLMLPGPRLTRSFTWHPSPDVPPLLPPDPVLPVLLQIRMAAVSGAKRLLASAVFIVAHLFFVALAFAKYLFFTSMTEYFSDCFCCVPGTASTRLTWPYNDGPVQVATPVATTFNVSTPGCWALVVSLNFSVFTSASLLIIFVMSAVASGYVGPVGVTVGPGVAVVVSVAVAVA